VFSSEHLDPEPVAPAYPMTDVTGWEPQDVADMPPSRDELLAHLVDLTAAGAVPPCVAYPRAGWTADAPRDQAYAARLCEVCPAVTPCRAYGIANPAELGVYGGMTTGDRRRAAATAQASA
jgi:hypothetical protein